MEATELRIFNFVYDNANQSEGIVTGINYDPDVSGIVIEVWYVDCTTDRIEPIPLTEEWLFKFGFRDNNYSFDKDIFHISWSVRVISTNVRSLFFLDGEIPDDWKINIKYVHQLQNLYFALTGEELEIKEK